MADLDASESFALPLAREERAAHLRGFRGRASLLDLLSQPGPAEGAGRFTLLLGGPGAGKSALAAALARRLDAPYHFVRAHREPRRFVPALIEQCRAIAGRALASDARSELVGASSDDLKNALYEALLLLARERGHAEVILDGLDELERPVDLLAFLPGVLPPRAHLLLTARPDLSLVATLRARCSPLQLLTLSALSLDDLRDQSSLPTSELRSLLDKTGGLPLLLFPALTQGERAGRVDLAQVAASERDLFEGLLAEAARRVGPPSVQLLSVLAIAPEPISRTLLAGVLELLSPPGPELPELRGWIEALSDVLEVSGEGHVWLWHASFAKYVREELVGARGARTLHLSLAQVCGHAPTSPFALRHAVWHRALGGDQRGALERAESADRAHAQLEAGLLPELLRDLERVGSAWLAPLRRQAAFLSAHPRGLASALSFEGVEPPYVDHSWVRTRWRSAPHGPLPTLTLEGQLPEVFALALDASGERLAVATQDGHVREYDATSGELLRDEPVSTKRALALGYAPEGRWLACGTDDGVAVLDVAARGGAARQVAFEAPVWGIAWLPDGSLAAGTRNGEIALLDRSLERLWTARLPFPITALAAGPQGTLLAGGARGGLVVLAWPQAAEGADPQRWPLAEDADGAVWSIAVRGDRFAVARHDGTITLFRLERDAPPQRLGELNVPDERLFALTFLGPDTLLCAGSAGRLHRARFTAEGLALEGSWLAHRGWVNSVQSGAGRLWSAGTDGFLLAHALDAMPPAREEDDRHPTALAISSAGEEIALGYGDGSVDLVRSLGSETTASVRHAGAAVSALALSPRFVLRGGRDGSLVLFRRGIDPRSKRPRLSAPTELERHDLEVTAAHFLSDHGFLVTASRDHSLRLYALVGARRIAAVETSSTIVQIEEVNGALVATDRDGKATRFSVPELAVLPGAVGSNGPVLVDGRYPRITDHQGNTLAALPVRIRKVVRVSGANEWVALIPGGVIQLALEG